MLDKMFKYFAENKLLVNLLIISFVLLGLYSITQLKQDLYPLASLDTIIINVLYPGASPKDVELNAVIPIERKLKNITGIKEYTSVSVENSARMEVYLDHDVEDVQQVKDEIFRELENVPDLAEDVEEVKLYDASPKLRAVYEIGVSKKEGYDVSDKKLYDFVDNLENKILKIEGVSDVRKEGYSDREIMINVDADKMNKYYISLSDVIDSIKTRNVRITGGTLQSVIEDKTIVTIGEFEDPLDVKNVIIRSSFEKNKVSIKEIAEVEDSFKKKIVDVKINSKDAVSLKIIKKENADVVKTSKRIREYLNSIKDHIPEGLEITEIQDVSLSISSLLKVVRSNALFGFLFVFLVLFLFLLDFRTSFWTAFCIPITVLLTMIFMNVAGYTINIISLGALVTVMGMLVDHGIVISEIIFEYKSKGLKPLDAVTKGIKEVIAPVTVTIVTTIVAFIPMFSIKGMMGKFIYIFPSVIIFTLIASFFEATCMLPCHLIHKKEKSDNKKDKKIFFINKNWFNPVADWYEKALSVILKYRYLVVVVFLLFFIVTIIISINPIKNFVLLDDESADQIFIKIEAPKGFNIERTKRLCTVIEDIIFNEVKKGELVSVKTLIGHHSIEGLKHKGYHENWGLIGINLVPLTERKRNADQIIDVLREKINTNKMKEFEKIIFVKQIMGPPTGDPIDIKIIGNDIKQAVEVKNMLQKHLSSIDGVIDIDDDQKEGKKEILVNFDYDTMARLGVNVLQAATTIRAAYEGYIASYIQAAKSRLDFRVKIDDSYKKDEKFLSDLLIPNKYGRLIKLGEIAAFSQKESKSSIIHYNGDKVITVTANIIPGKTTPVKVINNIKEEFKDISKKYPQIDLIYGGEAQETFDTFQDLVVTFIIAVILIYFVLVLLFRSIGQPLIVMITIPFGIIGAMLALIIHGITLSFLAIIGIIGLMGVVVNDSVIMVSFINEVFEKNKDKESIKNNITEGAKKRLRPVILTTLTTIAGLLPTAYGLGGEGGMLVPIVLSIAYGLLFATTLTLIFIPSLYLIRLDILGFINKIIKKSS